MNIGPWMMSFGRTVLQFLLMEIHRKDMSLLVSAVTAFDIGPTKLKQKISLNLHMKKGVWHEPNNQTNAGNCGWCT